MRIGPMLLSKAKDLTEGSVVNMVVSTICHPVDIIYGLIIEICSMKLSKHLLILVLLESHDVWQLKSITYLDDFVKLYLILVL
jgi:hypothetical protein